MKRGVLLLTLGAAVASAVVAAALVGAVGVTDDVTSLTVSLWPRNTSNTPDTTIAATAAEAATMTVAACLVRYHAVGAGLVRYQGVGGGAKLHVLLLNASKWPSTPA